MVLDTKDLQIDTVAASIPNAETWIRITHLPTGIGVEGNTTLDPSLTRSTRALVVGLSIRVEEHLQRKL